MASQWHLRRPGREREGAKYTLRKGHERTGRGRQEVPKKGKKRAREQVLSVRGRRRRGWERGEGREGGREGGRKRGSQ